MTKDRMISILRDTLQFYEGHPERFSRNSNGCLYLHPNGNKCAIGRLLTPTELKKWSKNVNEDGFSGALDIMPVPIALKGLPIGFGDYLQSLHDSRGNWDENGNLTESGKRAVRNIISKFDLGITYL